LALYWFGKITIVRYREASMKPRWVWLFPVLADYGLTGSSRMGTSLYAYFRPVAALETASANNPVQIVQELTGIKGESVLACYMLYL